MPACTRCSNSRAVRPSVVKIAAPLPYGLPLTSVERRLERLGPQQHQHRTEHLVAVDRHLGRDAVEQRRADPEALLVAGHLEPAAVAAQLGALLDAGVDRARHPVARGAGDQRAHLAAVLGARADLHRVDARFERRGQRVAGAARRRPRRRSPCSAGPPSRRPPRRSRRRRSRRRRRASRPRGSWPRRAPARACRAPSRSRRSTWPRGSSRRRRPTRRRDGAAAPRRSPGRRGAR